MLGDDTFIISLTDLTPEKRQKIKDTIERIIVFFDEKDFQECRNFWLPVAFKDPHNHIESLLSLSSPRTMQHSEMTLYNHWLIWCFLHDKITKLIICPDTKKVWGK